MGRAKDEGCKVHYSDAVKDFIFFKYTLAMEEITAELLIGKGIFFIFGEVFTPPGLHHQGFLGRTELLESVKYRLHLFRRHILLESCSW
jgi:hypothetical protein